MLRSEDSEPEVRREFDPEDCEVTITDDEFQGKLDYPFVNVDFKYKTGQIGHISIPKVNLEVLRDTITAYLEE